MWFSIILGLFLLSAFLLIIVVRIIEPAYVLMFNKPLYLYFYPIPKKLDSKQKEILNKEFPFYRELSAKRKVYFEHRIKAFLENYKFIGNDIEITQEIQIMISGTYVMLTFGMRRFLVERFNKIVVYRTQYFSKVNQEFHKGEYNPMMKAVVFSWEDFILGHQNSNDNVNLGLHEFSHVLHFHAMKSNDPSASIFFDEFNAIAKYYSDDELFLELVAKGYFREYAYENQFEFLAVVLEHFFESPEIFKNEFPELYGRVVKMINFK